MPSAIARVTPTDYDAWYALHIQVVREHGASAGIISEVLYKDHDDPRTVVLVQHIESVEKLLGFLRSAPDLTDQPKVIDGASDLLIELWGENGRHARTATGAPQLPFGAAVQIEMVMRLRGWRTHTLPWRDIADVKIDHLGDRRFVRVIPANDGPPIDLSGLVNDAETADALQSRRAMRTRE